jgi:hypothetical protein
MSLVDVSRVVEAYTPQRRSADRGVPDRNGRSVPGVHAVAKVPLDLDVLERDQQRGAGKIDPVAAVLADHRVAHEQ